MAAGLRTLAHEKRVGPQDVEEQLGSQQQLRRPEGRRQPGEHDVIGCLAPREPLLRRLADGSVVELLALGGEAQDVRDEERWGLLLVSVVDVGGAVEP